MFWWRRWTQEKKIVTKFSDLPDELFLLICRYLTPAQVLKVFSNYDERSSRCVTNYRQKIDLTKCSYDDFQFFLNLLVRTTLQPDTLILSNERLPTQLNTFVSKCNSTIYFKPTSVHRLSLLKCTQGDFYHISSFLKPFGSLESLRIVQSKCDGNSFYTDSKIRNTFHKSIFNSFTTLTDLELTTNNGVILDRQLRPNHSLTHLKISLQNINDLYILLDGLVPNLCVLRVVLCQSNNCKQSLLPASWPRQPMSHLKEFELDTDYKVSFTFDQLCHILTPLNQLEKLILCITQLHSNNGQFIESPQLEMLMQKFSPQLTNFICYIRTAADINMQTLAMMNDRWPMNCRSEVNDTWKHLYTVPWPFADLRISWLANDDTTSICSKVETLAIDTVYSDISHRFPNIQTLIFEPDSSLASTDYMTFRHLRHLSINGINQVPWFIIQCVHTLTLSILDDLDNHPIIYSNIKCFISKKNQISSSTMLLALVQHFPHVHTLEINLAKNDDYYDNLNILLDETHLPRLSLLKTKWVDNDDYRSDIDLWLKGKTRLKWRSTPFYGIYENKNLFIYL